MKTGCNLVRIGVVLIWSLSLGKGYGQSIGDFLRGEETRVSFQKLYIHTDRDFYFVGDTLYFAAYLLDGQTHVSTAGVGNLYIDLTNKDGRMTQQEVFPLVDGFCSGGICIGDTAVMEGNYLLRGYTDYLKNFGSDAFFHKTVQVTTVRSSFDLEQDAVEGDQRYKIDISFLPEGGFILSDEPNCVAFKAVDRTGKGVDVQGKIFDNDGEFVMDFESEYKGAGKIYFLPRQGKTYLAKIEGYSEHEHPLREMRDEGSKIKLNSVRKDKLQLVIQAKGKSSNRQHFLLCMNRGQGIFIEIPGNRLNLPINLATEQLRSGINRLVLLDDHFEPISERLVFVDDSESVSLQLDLNEQSFAARDPIKLELIAPDAWREENARVSVSVIDEKYAGAAGVEQNIKSYLLLDSELRGNIDYPADYFVDTEELSSTRKLDLLMTVNGWRDYIWNNLDSFDLIHEPKFGFTFGGNVERVLGKKPPKDAYVSMIVYNSDGTTTFFEEELDAEGNFEFENTVIYDSVGVFAQVSTKKNKHNAEFSMDLPSLATPVVADLELRILQDYSKIPVSLHQERYLDEVRLSEFFPDRNSILLDEVVVRANKSEAKRKTAVLTKNGGAHTIAAMETAGVTDIIQYLLNKVPGIIPIEGGRSISLGGGLDEPLIILDQGISMGIEQARGYSIEIFETIELVTPPMSYVYRAPSGVVLLTTKSGTALELKDTPLLGGIVDRVKGFSKRLRFYSPKYNKENAESVTPDLRNTLYWNPEVQVTGGKAGVSFFASDRLANYRIYVEGISESGKICLGEGRFTVDKESH